MRYPALIALLVVTGAASPLALAATPATTQILQQRTADGRLLLTDRAVPGAKTERSWKLQAEDPVAARQRALEVKAEAQIVSERVQRSIEQQRRFDEEMRLRTARYDNDRERTEVDFDGWYGGGGLWYPPYGLSGADGSRWPRDRHDHGGRPGKRFDYGSQPGKHFDRGGHRQYDGHRHLRGLKPLPLKGSAAPGSR